MVFHENAVTMFRSFLLVLLLMPAGVAVQKQAGKPDSQVLRLDEMRSQGYEALYNLDYEGARRSFTEMSHLFPSHPAGPYSLAATLWLKELNQSWKLKASLYSDEAKSSDKEKPDTKVIEEFRSSIRRAKSLSESRLLQNSSDVEAMYFLGATEGLESAFAAGVERRYRVALRSGSRSVERHKEVLKRAPDYRDAELTIGLYNYVVGSLPMAVKLVVATMGHRGSKKRGLETVERVAKEGEWARDVARVLLVDLYKREKRWEESAATASALSERYPRNYLFKLQIADALAAKLATQSVANRRGRTAAHSITPDEQRIFSIFEELLKDPGTTGDASNIIRFRYGETLLFTGHHARAANEFSTVTKHSTEKHLAVLARLRSAQASDLAGKRSEAIAGYRAVLAAPDLFNSHEQAKRGLKEPYKRK